MARPLRVEYPGAWYHVTCRGNEKRRIFNDDHDRARFIEILAESISLYRTQLHSYVLMDNHFHLLVMTPEANLNHFMQRLNTTYTVHFNRRHRRIGHLFQGRYKAIVIDADNYLLELSRYVHLNPVRTQNVSHVSAGEKRNLIRRYPWSSYGGYVSLRRRPSFVTYSQVLEMIGGMDDKEGRRRYEIFVMSALAQGMDINPWEEVRGQVVLGTSQFVDWIYERFLSEKNMDRRELPGLRELEIGPSGVAEIAKHVAIAFGVSEEELCRRRAPCAEARSVFLELCRRHLIKKMSFSEMGSLLGGISASALCQNSRRLGQRMKRDEDLRKSFEKLNRIWEKS